MASKQVLELIAAAHRDRATKLDLSSQNLTELPDSIGEIDSLVELNLSNNQLVLLPESIGNLHQLTQLHLQSNNLTELPESIGKLTKLKVLVIHENRLTKLPKSIGNLTQLTILRPCRNTRHRSNSKSNINELSESIGNLVNLKRLHVNRCQLADLPESICSLNKLIQLYLVCNQIASLPKNIGNLTRLNQLYLSNNKLTFLPESIGQLTKLKDLDLSRNKIAELPQSMSGLTNLVKIKLDGNPLTDLSILQTLLNLKSVNFLRMDFDRRYWKKFSEWKAEWLFDEHNAEIRRILVEQVGYERICNDLGAIAIDYWNEYTLLKIDNVEIVYQGLREVGREPMMLLKMTCPSTAHIHILRVPPDMTSSEDAIVWVNHGIHPSKFAIQT